MRRTRRIEGWRACGPRPTGREGFASPSRRLLAGLAIVFAMLQPLAASADERSQAKRMHDRLAGVPPTAAVLDQMAADIAAGRTTDAAYRAMEHRSFYDVTLKNCAMTCRSTCCSRTTSSTRVATHRACRRIPPPATPTTRHWSPPAPI
jgi:hypothetical protein